MTHEINSIMLYIHPPLAIIGYIFIIFLLYRFTFEFKNKQQSKAIKKWMIATWLINLLGLITGMLWAGIAWNSYWSWDPKETVTLIMFTFLCLSIIQYEQNKKISYLFLLITTLFIMLNVFITFSNFSIHSYGL